jgi:NAD(P)H-dependent FMN reductase
MLDAKILVIIGSVRPQRIGMDVAAWVAAIGRESLAAVFELVDLRDWPLPMDAEPGIPAHGQYEHPTTKAWSARIDGADGFVFVTPQYNWGYPAPLKNAIDHLYAEWRGKPAAIITYGGHGGGKCAAQLHEVLSGLKMKLARTMPALTLPPGQVQTNPGWIDAASAFSSSRADVVAALREMHAVAISNSTE